MKTFDGYKKQALTDVYALLAGGGHKPLSEFSMAHTHPYLPLSGGTMLGSIKFNSNSLPQKTLSYVCGIDAFADGGEMGWMRGSDFVTQYAPTKTGIGASGTWNISITGNASTATNADTLDGYHLSTLVDRSGENLIIGTTHASIIGWNQNGWSGGISTYDANNGIYKMWSTNGWHTLYYTLDSQYASKSISFSFDIMFISSESTEGPVAVYVGPSNSWFSSTNYYPSTSDLWEHKKGTFTLGSTPIFGIMIQGTDSSGKSCFYRIKNLKVELGDLPTIWTPAHADITWDNLIGKPSSFTPSSHTHAISEVTNLQAALDGKAAASHTHSYLPYIRSASVYDANTIADGWADLASIPSNVPTGNHGSLLTVTNVGTPYQIFIPDASYYIYKRFSTSGVSSGNWSKLYAGYADSSGNADTLDGNHASAFATAGHTHSYLPLSGGTLTGSLVIQETTSAASYAWSGGAFHAGYANIILRGNSSTGVSGIVFTSSKGTTDINQPTDRGFIQFHACGVAPADEGAAPTLSTSGESNKLVIGVGNDGDDMVYIQTPNLYGLRHLVGTSAHVILNSGNFNSYSPKLDGTGANGTWGISITGNADTVDGYHASSLWRSDGATWNPGANVSLNASGNNQEWSFDIRRNGHTGCIWHVWDSDRSSMLRVNADNGKVYAPYNFVGNLEGNASSSSKWLTARTFTIGNTSKNVDGSGNVSWSLSEIGAASSSHTHPYLPLSGGTISGNLAVTGSVTFLSEGKLKIWNVTSTRNSNYGAEMVFVQTSIDSADPETKWPDKNRNDLFLQPKGGHVHIGPIETAQNYTCYVAGTLRATDTITAPTFSGNLSGNASTATALTTSAGSATLPIYFNGGKPVACTASLIFSNLSNSGNNISVTVAGLNRTLTVGYASAASKINSRGNLTAYEEGSTTKGESGVNFYTVYNNGYPVTYGNLLHINGSGAGQILAEWCGNSTLGHLYYRSKRDNSEHGWSAWGKVAFVTDNVTSATKLQTVRTIWGQSFNGTANVDNTLRIKQTTGNYCEGIRIQTGDGAWATIILGATADTGTNANAWSIHRKADNNFAISRNSSDGINGLVMTSVGMGLGTTAPTHRLDVRGDTKITGSIRDLAIGGGIYWNPYVESTTDGSDVASITVVKSGIAGGTTLVLRLMNDANDTILFLTSTAAKLYHNSYPILTTLNTYVSNNKGYINGAEITLVNNASSASIATKLASSGYANNALSYYQTDQAFDGSATGWAHYIIANHGDGASYYHYTIRLPFSNVPQYRRLTGSTSNVTSWYNFITAENIGSQSVNYATSAGNADKVDGYHKTDLIGNLSKGNWNPRNINLAMDWHYNGGDISISENGGKIFISIDGSFWLNEGQYRVLDTSDAGSLSVKYANSAGNADTLDGLHANAFATASHSHPYLPLSGGTMTGLIKGNNKGGSWILGRSNAALYQPRTTTDDWHPVIGFKTKTGSWEFGNVGNDDFATFSWESDSNYSSGTNTNTRVNLRTISGTIALTSDIPTKSSWNYDDRYYTKTESDNRFVNIIGDTITGTLTTVTTGSNSYNQGIRINRTATNQWATLLIGKSGTATTGTGTSTAGDGAWLIATPASSNSLIFNLNNASETVGLCLKGHGNTDIKWNNNTIWHAGNDGSGSGLDADKLDGYHASSFATSSHTHSYIIIPTCSSLNGNSNNFSVEYAGGNNSVATKPSGVDAFGVMRLRTAGGWYGQILMSANTAPGIYYRNANGLTSSIGWIKLLDSSNSSVSGGGSAWGSSITVKINGTSKTLAIPSNPNTDYRVTQSDTTTTNYRPLVLGYINVSTAGSGMTGSVTNQVYLSNKFYVQPSTGNLYATTFVGSLSGNASSATSASKWTTARTLTLTGSVTGSVYIDGSSNVTLTTTTNHTHNWTNIEGKPNTFTPSFHTHDDRYYTESEINTKLGAYLPLSGGTMNANARISFNDKGNLYIGTKDNSGYVYFQDMASQDGTSYWCISQEGDASFKGTVTATTFSGALSGNATTATTASKLGSSTVGSGTRHFYLNAGTATASTATVGGTAKPMYLKSGVMTALTVTVGSKTKPVYLSGGTITACSSSLTDYLPLTGGSLSGDLYVTRNTNAFVWAKYSAKTAICMLATSSYVGFQCGNYAWNGNVPMYITGPSFTDGSTLYLKFSDVNASGSIYATHFYENSDIRYKKILKNLSINSNIIANLPLFDFEWIENNAIGTGTSALAVQLILPNIVSGTDKLTLDYGVLGTIAGITACKELVTLKSELLQLKEKVKLLEDKLRKYENI